MNRILPRKMIMGTEHNYLEIKICQNKEFRLQETQDLTVKDPSQKAIVTVQPKSQVLLTQVGP